MSYAAWLFLYLAGLVELAVRYRATLHHPSATLAVLLPLLAMAAPHVRHRALRWVGVALTLGCALAMARVLSLDFWNTERLDLAVLSAGIGLGGLLAVREDDGDPTWELVNWLLIAGGWLCGLWLPLGPWIAMGAAATLSLWPRPRRPLLAVAGRSAPWLLFWIGMAISKPWWDSDEWGAWVVALWAAGVAGAYLPRVRGWRPPRPLLLIALFALLYAWLPHWLWAVPLGLLCGCALQGSARPWSRAAGYALLAGMLLSYLIHSNLELFGPLVWGAR